LYYTNKLSFLEKHISLLTELKHNLDKIIFNINLEDGDYDIVNKALKIIPKKINQSEVEVRLRKNIGMSYGAWSDCFLENKDKYDYFIFNEDDYFFIIDNFDDILIDKFNSKDNAGYLCGIVLETLLLTNHYTPLTQQEFHQTRSYLKWLKNMENFRTQKVMTMVMLKSILKLNRHNQLLTLGTTYMI
jgi:hypothetical protein